MRSPAGIIESRCLGRGHWQSLTVTLVAGLGASESSSSTVQAQPTPGLKSVPPRRQPAATEIAASRLCRGRRRRPTGPARTPGRRRLAKLRERDLQVLWLDRRRACVKVKAAARPGPGSLATVTVRPAGSGGCGHGPGARATPRKA